jgi:hypothetical protein
MHTGMGKILSLVVAVFLVGCAGQEASQMPYVGMRHDPMLVAGRRL